LKGPFIYYRININLFSIGLSLDFFWGLNLERASICRAPNKK